MKENARFQIPNHLQKKVAVSLNLHSGASAPEAGEPGFGVLPGVAEPAGIDTVAQVPVGSAPGDTAPVGIEAAYTGDSYHNTIGHIAVYISFDYYILGMHSFFHLSIIYYYLANYFSYLGSNLPFPWDNISPLYAYPLVYLKQ